MTTFSYSRLATHKKCPKKYKFAYIDKIAKKGERHPAAARGTRIHDSVEKFLLGKADRLDPEIHEQYGQFITGLRELGAEPEVKFGLDWKWGASDFNSEHTMFRGLFDIHLRTDNEFIIYELKTGKEYKEHVDQGWCYGVTALILNPDQHAVKVVRVYFDQGTFKEVTYFQDMVQREYLGPFRAKIDAVLLDKRFPANPGWGCKYCEFSKARGGPCEFG